MTIRFKPLSGAAWLALSASLLVSACGGGGGSSGTTASSAAQTSVYSGPITGFGSVIVNGVRFDTVGAPLTDDDGNAVHLSDLALGMTVTVSGEADDGTGRGTAHQLSLVHGTTGPISAIDVPNGQLTLLGQTVKTNAATAYDGVTGLAALLVGDVVEVYGVVQADGSLLATLIEKYTAPVATLRVMGLVGTVDATHHTFQLGNLTVDYGSATVSGTLATGKLVKVKAAASALANNVLKASSVKVSEGAAYGVSVAAGSYLKLKGVADAAPVNGQLTVSGVPVDVSQATISGGSAITAGAYLSVRGTWSGTVLNATKVELEDFQGNADEVFGAVSSINGSQVVVNGVTVDLSTASFEHGTLGQVAVGSYIEIKGHVQGNLLVATQATLQTPAGAQGLSYEQHGRITDFVSASSFKINGLPVDASGAKFEGGTAASLANGVYVEVKGAQNGSGVYVATQVDISTGN